MTYEVVGHSEDVPTVLAETDTLAEARAWIESYAAREDAGGWSCITVNAVPFVGDFELEWTKSEGFI